MVNDQYYNEVSVFADHVNSFRSFPPHRSISSDPDPDALDNNQYSRSRPVQFESNRHQGKLSKKSARSMLDAYSLLDLLSQKRHHKLNFITVTLSSNQIHSDNEITYKILHPFLTILHRRWKVDLYLWRAEKQANGRLHFHIIISRFIPWDQLREVWNNCQNKLGYVSRYRRERLAFHASGFRFDPADGKGRSRDHQYKGFLYGCRTDWHSPNSTDVHSLYAVGSVRAYITTYLKKTDQTSGVTCNLWGCSKNLENIQGARNYQYSALKSELVRLQQDPHVWYRSGDYFEVFYFTPGYLTPDNYPELYECLQLYLQQKFPEIVHPELTLPAAA